MRAQTVRFRCKSSNIAPLLQWNTCETPCCDFVIACTMYATDAPVTNNLTSPFFKLCRSKHCLFLFFGTIFCLLTGPFLFAQYVRGDDYKRLSVGCCAVLHHNTRLQSQQQTVSALFKPINFLFVYLCVNLVSDMITLCGCC